MTGPGLRHWLTSSDAAAARVARRSLRGAKRTAARLRSGSVSAEMDRIVATANDSSIGSGLEARLAHRTAGRAARARSLPAGPEHDRPSDADRPSAEGTAR